MTTTHIPGELRLRILGDLCRNPLTNHRGIMGRLDLDRDVLRMTLRRMVDRGWVRRHQEGFMLTRAGIDYLATVRRWVAS